MHVKHLLGMLSVLVSCSSIATFAADAKAGACVSTTCTCDDDCNGVFTCVDGLCCNYGAEAMMGTPCAGGSGGATGAGGTSGMDRIAPPSGGSAGVPVAPTSTPDVAPSPSGTNGAPAGTAASTESDDSDDDEGGCTFTPRGTTPTSGPGILLGLLGALGAAALRRRTR